MKKLAHLFSTVFFAGYIPFAPGTFASLIGLLFVYTLSNISVLVYFIIGLFIFFIGFLSIDLSLKDLKTDDPKQIVIDEVMGIYITFFAVKKTLPILCIGFLLFRFFDITKVFYIKKLQKIQGTMGIIIDDIVSGLLANIILNIISIDLCINDKWGQLYFL
ncbi:hypothetical protein B9J78_02760 [bacterium Unc6]|nr:hypothetical protein [bacterium Unc6]